MKTAAKVMGSKGLDPWRVQGSALAFSPVAIVLPPRESFSPTSAGAIALTVATLADAADVVIGHAPAGPPFGRCRFVPARVPWLRGPDALATYARGVAATLAPLRPRRIEVHNKPRLAAFLARRFPGTSVGLVLHNDPRSMPGARSAAERAVLGSCVAVAVVSHHLAALWGERCTVLPNAIDEADLPAPILAKERDNLVLFAGRVVADKGADVFVDACARALPELPGWRAAMVGADRFGPDSPDTAFLRALRPRAAAAGVELRGYAPRAAVLRAMAGSAITAVPSRWAEPFGLAALEAMACGSALITTREGGLPEVAGDVAVYVPAGDADALARAIVDLARDRDAREALSARGIERARLFEAGAARARLALWRTQA